MSNVRDRPFRTLKQTAEAERSGKAGVLVSVLDSLRTGIKFFLMSMGVSSPAKKPKPPAKPAPKA
jgi:hypothetical protein